MTQDVESTPAGQENDLTPLTPPASQVDLDSLNPDPVVLDFSVLELGEPSRARCCLDCFCCIPSDENQLVKRIIFWFIFGLLIPTGIGVALFFIIIPHAGVIVASVFAVFLSVLLALISCGILAVRQL